MSNLNRILVGIRDSKLSRTQTNILLNRLVSVSSEITNESFVIKTIKTKIITFKRVARTSTKPGQILVESESLFLKDLLVIIIFLFSLNLFQYSENIL